jgi:hypothetical protein
MQRTANFPHQIADARLPKAAGVVDDTTALDAAVDVLDPHATARAAPIGGFLCPCESPAPWLPGGHDDLDLVEHEGQEAEILEPPAARGPGIRCGIRHPFGVRAAGIGGAQEEERQGRMDQHPMFHGIACFLATITARLLKRVLGVLRRRAVPLWPIGGSGRPESEPPRAARPGAMAPPVTRPERRLQPRPPP